MPRSPTEIPHLAFTHHRIGVHDGQLAPSGRGAGRGELRPFLELTRLRDAHRKRSLGLGYLEVANREKEPLLAADYRERALELMTEARSAGVRDAVLDVGLARLRFDLRRGDVLSLARDALAHADLAGQDRCTALFLLADAESGRGCHAEAVVALRELTRLRRHAVDWLLLADCERALGHRDAADAALTTAVRINPRLWKVHQYLADQYARQGDADRAAWHRQRAVP
jgi:tetratricopeptide (TPR) repeat protein